MITLVIEYVLYWQILKHDLLIHNNKIFYYWKKTLMIVVYEP
jgi:hypothetical protein